MDVQTARAILSEAASGGWLNDEIPEDELDLIDLGQYYYDEALKADWADDHIHAIINLGKTGEVSPPVLSAPVEPDSLEGPPGEINSEGDWQYTEESVHSDDPIRKTYPRRSSGGYSESDLRDFEGMPLPEPIPEAALNMPMDLTELGDKAVRRLYSAFNAYSGRARWLLAISQSNLANATHLRDEFFRVAYVNEYRQSKLREEKLSQATLENLARETEEYREWDTRVEKHTKEVTNWRALLDIYSKNVEVISRDWTMRESEWQRDHA